MSSKICVCCENIKKIKEFYKHTRKNGKSYYARKCKCCVLSDCKRSKGLEKLREKYAESHGDIVKKIRKYLKKGFTQQEMSEKLHLKYTTIRGWFNRYASELSDE